MSIEISSRIKRFPPYLFFELDKKKNALLEQGYKIIDLGVGDPDIKCPASLIEIIYQESKKKENQKYAFDKGDETLRNSICRWMKRRFNVNLDPQKEILPLIGSKEGIVHFPLGILNKGDLALVPNPCYPPYRSAVLFCEAQFIDLPLKEEDNFLPQITQLPSDILNKTKILFLNYPNNPTSFCANKEFLQEVVNLGLKYNFVIVYDNAYSEIYFDSPPLSILEIEGAKQICIEFHSFSKTFCMTGFRLGWACGNQDLINLLLKIKSNIDSGIFTPIQKGGAYLLDNEQEFIQNLRNTFLKRRNLFIEGLRKIGLQIYDGRATFYLWVKTPKKISSTEFTNLLLEEAKVLTTPGRGFGEYADNFIRISLTQDTPLLQEALERISKINF